MNTQTPPVSARARERFEAWKERAILEASEPLAAAYMRGVAIHQAERLLKQHGSEMSPQIREQVELIYLLIGGESNAALAEAVG